MSTPAFAPIPSIGQVRPTMSSPLPEYNRKPKPGMLRFLPDRASSGLGTQAPGEGYTYTLAYVECQRLVFEDPHTRPGVELALALLAAKRASLFERAPILGDVRAARDLLGLAASDQVSRSLGLTFSALTHNYVAQRAFSDSVPAEKLLANSLLH